MVFHVVISPAQVLHSRVLKIEMTRLNLPDSLFNLFLLFLRQPSLKTVLIKGGCRGMKGCKKN